MNKVIFLGRLATEPELKYSQNGTPVAKFSLAVARENDREKADFFFCTAFGKLAQSMADYCQKGRQVMLEGRIEINVVQDQQQGNKTYVNVIVQSCEFLAKPQQSNQQQNYQQPAFTQQQPMNSFNGQATMQNQQQIYNNSAAFQTQNNFGNPAYQM